MGLAYERICMAHIPQIKRALRIDGISTLSLEKVLGTVYTLSGQRVEKPRKGRLYIVNGRKVVLK